MWKMVDIYEADYGCEGRMPLAARYAARVQEAATAGNAAGAAAFPLSMAVLEALDRKQRVMVKLEYDGEHGEDGEVRVVSVYDEYLTFNKIDVGSVWEEPGEEKLELFWKQKKTMDTFLKTGALSEEQYAFSLSGLLVKMGLEVEDLVEK